MKLNEQKLLSVIVPIYNVEAYLPRCLDSIINQTYRKLEIICIDDGSTDNVGKILDEYAEKDSRIIAKHQKNQGESNARNKGLQLATGDYIGFVDCDDWIKSDMYETLINCAEMDNLDMVASSWFKDDDYSSNEIKNKLEVNSGIFGRDELLGYIYKRDYYRGFAYMWNKLYKREVLTDEYGNMIQFDEQLRLGGDVLYLAQAAVRTKRAKYIDKAFYHYYQRTESGCHTKDLSKMRDWLKAYEKIIELMKQNEIANETIDYIKRFMAYHSSNAAEIAIEQKDDKCKKEFQSIMRQYRKEYIHLNVEFPERIARYESILKS